MALIKCSECGADISEKASLCPKCGCPIELSIKKEKDEKKKLIIKVLIPALAILIIIIAGFGIYKIVNRSDTSGIYNGLDWEMTYDEVIKQLPEETIVTQKQDSVSTMVKDFEDKKGVDSLTSYKFDDESLKTITMFITRNEDSTYTDDSLKEEYTQQLDKLYGEHEEELLSSVWMTEKSKIKLSYLLDGLFVLSYEDITRAED